MATQIIMDRNGDTRHSFDVKDVKALLEAERQFTGTNECWLHRGNPYRFRRASRDANI